MVDTQRIRKIAFIGHDNSGSRLIFDQIRYSFPDTKNRVIIATGLYYGQSILKSVLRLAFGSSILFCAARAFEMLKYRLSPMTIEKQCRRASIPYLKTADINAPESLAFLREFQPDLIVALYTMHIFRSEILTIPKLGAVSSHPSILPEYRGLEVFFWQLANGETNSGVSVFYLTEKIDVGAVLNQRVVPIGPTETMYSLYRKITEVAADLLIKTIDEIDRGVAVAKPVSGKGTYYGMPTRAAMRKFLKAGWRLG